MLEKLADTTVETQRKWLQFMLERVGHNNLPSLLDYYRNIGWISPPVTNRLLELSSQEKRYKGTSWTLSAEEHRISRLYVEKLGGRQIDESLLSVPAPGRAKPEPEKKVILKVKDRIHPVHPAEKKKFEFALHRREVTISNLEQELEEKNTEIDMLKERIRELEEQLDDYRRNIERNKIYMEIFDQNSRLKRASFADKRGSGKGKK